MTVPPPTPVSSAELLDGLERFRRRKILVVGDAMLDHYLTGGVERVSPEAPVPVVKLAEERYVLGGAANVVHNVVALGAEAHLVAVVGDDDAAGRLRQLLVHKGVDDRGLLTDSTRSTTLKTRVIGNHQQVARIDREHTHPLPASVAAKLRETVTQMLPNVDGVIVSDYAKGVLAPPVVRWLLDECAAHGKPTFLDPKSRNFAVYAGATYLTPNHHEAGSAVGRGLLTLDDVRLAAEELRATGHFQALVITFAARGMCLLDSEGHFHHIPAQARQVFDVTGAGDTVIATLALGVTSGMSAVAAATLANQAAGIVVGLFGTSVVTTADLAAELTPLESTHASPQQKS